MPSPSSSSCGPLAPLCLCNDFRWFSGALEVRQRDKKLRRGESKVNRKRIMGKRRKGGRGWKSDGDTTSLLAIMKTVFQLNCLSLLCKQNSSWTLVRWGLDPGWAHSTGLNFFLLPVKRGTAHRHTPTPTHTQTQMQTHISMSSGYRPIHSLAK